MKKGLLAFLWFLFVACFPPLSSGKEFLKVVVWDLDPMDNSSAHAKQLTSFVVSEITKLKKYEVYSQENVRTLAGWTAERMQLGCTDTKCLTALGQMDISKLISGSVGKIGRRYTVSLNLFDTQNARAENAISKTCESEDELIELIQAAVPELLGESPTLAAETVPTEYRDPTTGMEFVLIKGGCFEMGDTFGDANVKDQTVHEVCVDEFYLGKHEVTQGQWQEMMGSNPSYLNDCGRNCPVEQVSWNDVQEFISMLNQRSGRRFRLPTEAEWEYAARSGGKWGKWSGTSSEGELGQYAWYRGNSGSRAHAVGEKRPNGLGLYDMTGNVWEWCSDWYGGDYYQRSPKNNPKGPGNGSIRVLRGGSWQEMPGVLRATYRGWAVPSYRHLDSGFRLGLPAQDIHGKNTKMKK